MNDRYDVVVIGAGPGGYVCAIRARQLGLKVACIERDKPGGICLNWGCIPTKALLKAADLAHAMRHADQFGISAVEPTFDIKAMVGHSRDVASRLERGVGYLFTKNGVDHITGNARLVSENQISIDTEDSTTTIEANYIVIATGARPRTFPGIEPDGEVLWTSKQALVPAQIPKSMIVLGAGAIGCEFAYFYNALGTKVTLVELADRILPGEDKEVSTFVARQFADQGIDVHTATRCQSLERVSDSARAHLDGANGPQTIDAERALIGMGVVGNSTSLGLEELGIEVEGSFIRVDERNRTSVASIWAIGDVAGPPALAHKASAEGINVAEQIAGRSPAPIHRDLIPYCTYCQPEVAHVGLTEEQAWEQDLDYSVGRFPFSANGKALGAGHPEGFVKVLLDKQYGEILGVHIVGHGATDLLAEAGLAMTTEVTAEALLETIHPHPTLSEAILEAVASAKGEAIHI